MSVAAHCVDMTDDSLVLLTMLRSEIINYNNTPRHPNHLCLSRTFLIFLFQFYQSNRIQLGQTRVKPNSDLIQKLIEMLTAGLTLGNIFSSDCDAKVAAWVCLGGILSIFTLVSYNVDVDNWTVEPPITSLDPVWK